MKYKYIVLDFETKDPFIKLKMGSGWVYPGNNFKILGMSIVLPDDTTKYITTKASMKTLLAKTDTLIVFNANYDVGIIHKLGIDIQKYTIIDVLLQAKMNNSTEEKYNLNYLSKKYLKDKKSEEPLGLAAEELGLVKSKSQSSIKVAKENMDLLQKSYYDLVAEYAIYDAVLTKRLWELFNNTDGYVIDFYSDLIKANILSRARGVPIDLIQLNKIDAEFTKLLMNAQLDLNKTNKDLPVNVMSPKDVPQLLISHGVNLQKNDKDNYICDKKILENLNHPVADKILRVRKLRKLKNDFIGKIIDIQKYTISAEPSDFGSKALIGYIYPEIALFGAAATGRCSASGPNIQQIPSRGGEEAKLIRTLIVPFPTDSYVCASDFSAQEPRLIINDAALIKAEGIQPFIDEFNNNPSADFHQLAADLMGVSRNEAKTIGLGLLYGMGSAKLSIGLGKSIEEAQKLKDRYFKALPFMRQFQDKITKSLAVNGYIKTIGGNKLRLDAAKGKQTFEYKALNKRIQGSAAYQTNKALVDLYRAGIDYLFPVHDEIVASIKNKEAAYKIQEVMENAYKLCIPSKSDVQIGATWAECK